MRRIDLDGSRIHSKVDFLDAVAQALEFPDYFGSNWDALDECLGDITEPTIVVWSEPDKFEGADPGEYRMALRVFADTEAPVALQLVQGQES